jgi:ribonuclease R
MLAANEAVATELVNRGVALVHRYHAPPNDTKIEELTVELKGMGFQPGDLRVRRNMARFLRSVQDDPLAYHVQLAVLRSMSRAVYSATNAGHFGLAKKMYAHFTSPIRRYPDLIVHRQLGAVLADDRKVAYGKPELGSIAQGCSETEQRAEEAERELLEIKKCRFLEEQLAAGAPRTYEAVIVKVTNFGLFVDVPRLRVQGLVHVSEISDRFVRFSSRSGTLRDGRDVYKIGSRMDVVVSRVDFDQRRIDFRPA